MIRAGKRAAYVRSLPALCLLPIVATMPAYSQADNDIPTLRVYVNTVQIPALVLGPAREPLKQTIEANRFSISLDSGPWFRATHVRKEGEDPITLAILLDTGGEAARLMPKIDEAIAALVPEGLHPQDSVSLYATDCEVLHVFRDRPPDRAKLHSAVNAVLTPALSHRGAKCRETTHIRDSLMYVAADIGHKPGRRVLLAVTDGTDHGSRTKWDDLRGYAQGRSVTVFGLMGVTELMMRDPWMSAWAPDRSFISLCESSGGMFETTTMENVNQTMQSFMKMLRERYIVEFPRAHNATPGRHDLRIKIDRANDLFIRLAGDSMPTPDASLLADKNTVTGDPEKTPQQGKKP